MSASAVKVLLITARADLGGGPRHVLDLLRAFQPDETRFFVAAPEQKPFAPMFREHCERFVEIPARRFSLPAFLELARLVRANDVDLIHSHGRGAGLYSRLLGIVTGRPVAHSYHGVHTATGPVGRLKLLIDQALAYLPFYAIFSSDFERARAVRHHVVRGELTVVPNAVDLSRFSREETQARSTASPRIGVFLRDDHVKGPDLWLRLIDSARSLPEFRDAVFTCAGISAEELARHGRVPEELEIAGPLDNPVPWLESLSVLVSTSRSEGLPLGVLEAMAARVPCLLSDITGHEIFFQQGFAVRLDASSPESFTAALNAMLADRDQLRARATKARHWLEEEFSLTTFKERLLAVYRELANRRRVRGTSESIDRIRLK